MRKLIRYLAFCIVFLTFKLVTASVIIDFDTDDSGIALVNGQQIASPDEAREILQLGAR